MATNMVHTDGGFRSRIMAVMSYLGILCFVPLVSNKNDEFVHFHAKQGVVIWMWGVFGVFSLYLPGLGKWMFSVSVAMVLILSLIGIVSALLNRAWKLPLIYSVSTYI
jgi:fumarate reductase subunit D